MEQEFDLKCEEYIEIIEQKEKALKLLLEHSKDQTDKLEAVTR